MRDVVRDLELRYGHECSHKLFLSAFALFVLSRFIEDLHVGAILPIDKEAVAQVAQVASLLFLMLPLVSRIARIHRGERVLLAGIGVLVFVTALVSHSLSLVWLLIFVVAGAGIDVRDMAKISIVIGTIALLVAFALFALGLSDPEVASRAGEVRWSLGFSHPNRLGRCLLLIGISWCILRFGSFCMWDVLALAALALFVYIVPNSRTSALCLLMAAVIAWLIQRLAFSSSVSRVRSLAVIGAALVAVLAIASLALAFLYDATNPFMTAINDLLAKRLSIPHGLLQITGISLLGSDIGQFASMAPHLTAWGDVPIDNAYIRLFLYWGPVVFAGFIALMVAALVKLSKNTSRDGACILFGVMVCSIIGLAESSMLDVSFNYCLIPLLGVLLVPGGNRSDVRPDPGEAHTETD